MVSTRLKNIRQKLGHLPNFWGENTNTVFVTTTWLFNKDPSNGLCIMIPHINWVGCNHPLSISFGWFFSIPLDKIPRARVTPNPNPSRFALKNSKLLRSRCCEYPPRRLWFGHFLGRQNFHMVQQMGVSAGSCFIRIHPGKTHYFYISSVENPWKSTFLDSFLRIGTVNEGTVFLQHPSQKFRPIPKHKIHILLAGRWPMAKET